MSLLPVVVSLPIADGPTSFAFYREGLGLDAIGEPAEDGVPEPLQFALNDGVRLMLVPTGGSGWITGDHEVARAGTANVSSSLVQEPRPALTSWSSVRTGPVLRSSRNPDSSRGATPVRSPTPTVTSGW